ncbi:tetratricopeptide repeat protein [candidate division KSB1 bacterium]|nr:tetratricopeptide repeat protein [candidate division KSB1 bacterium]
MRKASNVVWMILLTSLLTTFVISFAAAQENAVQQKLRESGVKHDDRDIRIIKTAAKQIYRQAVELYEEGSYWKCCRELIILMDFYTDFEKMDGVIFHIAECLYEEELNEAAVKMYKYLLKNYPKSEYFPKALFGIEKVNYNAEKYKETLSVYYQILKLVTDQEILNAARYFAGQSHYYLKNHDTALEILKQISNNTKYYDGALYTTALIYLRKKSIPIAIDYFSKIISLPIISGERRRIVDDSRLTLGYIYYELGLYREARELFWDISERHENYQDALLALGWANLKMENYEETIEPLLKLIDFFPESANAEESYFLLGQAYIALKEYDKAIRAYKTIVDLFPNKLQNVSIIKKVNNSLEVEQSKIEELKVQLLIQESKLLTTLPLAQPGDKSENYLVKEHKKIENFRENLITNLLRERDNLIFMKNQIDRLKKVAERKEKRKDWRGYAEYGISRALFLKEMEMKAN